MGEVDMAWHGMAGKQQVNWFSLVFLVFFSFFALDEMIKAKKESQSIWRWRQLDANLAESVAQTGKRQR